MKVVKKSNNQGYIFCPYIFVNNVMKIDGEAFSPNKTIESRYSVANVNSGYYGTIMETRNNKRKRKIENIFKIDN